MSFNIVLTLFVSLQKGLEMEKERMLETDNINLSDFVLFLSVMKEKKAYQNTLSIIMDEPDIQIREVKVEQVILNKSGKRAIRLDAWAVSEDERQFNMEMENHSGEKISLSGYCIFFSWGITWQRRKGLKQKRFCIMCEHNCK